MNGNKKAVLMRAALLALALLLAAGWYFAAAYNEQRETINSGRDKLQLDAGGTVSVAYEEKTGGTDKLAVNLGGTKNAKELTLTLTLTDASGRVAAREEKPLAKAKNNSFLAMEGLHLAAGAYTLTIDAAGEGYVPLLGVRNGDAVDLCLRVTRIVPRRNSALLYFAGLLALLACCPVSGGRRKAHA